MMYDLMTIRVRVADRLGDLVDSVHVREEDHGGAIGVIINKSASRFGVIIPVNGPIDPVVFADKAAESLHQWLDRRERGIE